MSYFDARQEAEEFEQTAEDMELYAMRMEAEAEANREAQMEEQHEAWCRDNFRKNLADARRLLAEGKLWDAWISACDAQVGAVGDGQRRLAAALAETIAKVRGKKA
jgi:hypothetical protein